jgi:hypothetical protein
MIKPRHLLAWATCASAVALAACGNRSTLSVRADTSTTSARPPGIYYEVPTDPAVFALTIVAPASVVTGSNLTIRGTCAFATDVSLNAFYQANANPDPIAGRPPEATGLGSPAVVKSASDAGTERFDFVLPIESVPGVYFYRIACTQDDYWISDALTPQGLAIHIFPPEKMLRIEVLPSLPKGTLPPTG